MASNNWWNSASQIDLFQRRFETIHMDRRALLKLAGAATGSIAALSLLAACEDDDEETAAEEPDDDTEVDEPDDDAEVDEPDDDAEDEPDDEDVDEPDEDDDDEADEPSGDLAAEQVLRTNFERDPQSQDFNKDLYCGGEMQLFAMLGQFDVELEAVPDIAESWETDDAVTWTFHIREDSGWSNGDPVTAHDYEWSWKRQLNPETAAPYAGFLYDILNAEAYNLGEIEDEDEVGVRAVDDYTLEVVCEGPRAYLPTVVTYIAAAPSHRPSVEEHGDQWTEAENIVTNGPWTLERWDHDVTVDMIRNENYWNSESITLERVVRPIIGSDASQLAFENDEIDWHFRGQLGQLERVENDPELSEQMHRYNLTGTWYLVPDPNFEPFDVPEVRLAIGHAIDRDAIVDQVLRGLATPAYTFQPPGAPGYDENTYDEYTSYDPDLAMSMLDGTPYEGGENWPDITLTHREEGDAPRAAAEAIIEMLRQNLNMDIEHEIGEPVETYERMWEHRIQFMWVRWFNDYPDPNNTLYQVWYSGFPDGNRHAWSDEEFDQLVDEARGEDDEDERWAMYQRANEIQIEQGAAIYVYNPWNYGLMKPWVTNFPRNSDGDFVPNWNIFIRDYDHYQILEH
ncbi:MAG: peptide ABC transporter substrate-binding protein [Sphaerobacteraceae bacterium]|nr:MAG: peptide ABC transporter substrate-binding protein [Sphaerobacteraceae bacterium]